MRTGEAKLAAPTLCPVARERAGELRGEGVGCEERWPVALWRAGGRPGVSQG